MEAFDKEVPSKVIGELIIQELPALDQVAYVRFASVYREFKDVTQFLEELKPMLEKPRLRERSPPWEGYHVKRQAEFLVRKRDGRCEWLRATKLARSIHAALSAAGMRRGAIVRWISRRRSSALIAAGPVGRGRVDVADRDWPRTASGKP